MKEMRKLEIEAVDGKLGSVEDFYFDDRFWAVRYIVVATGGWLSGRKVLISPSAAPDGDPVTDGALQLRLTRRQVRCSPGIDADLPVSRQEENALVTHYGWVPYWASLDSVMLPPQPARPPVPVLDGQAEEEERTPAGDPALRSVREVTGYRIAARDGDIGHVDDFLGHTTSWLIRYLVVDTRNWLPGRTVLVAPTWIERVDWARRKVHVDLDTDAIRKSPEHDPSGPVPREYEAALYRHYGRKKYWHA
jgi:hypothetical protein